ncbi:MAG TPA: T9SS type A sorting domain-containing protein [Puia sp.]|nr:T9SS type A sorting domain-containing protein [Puia sp.]
MARAQRALLFATLFVLSYPVHAANRFWISATASNWNNPANWSATSGGAGGASVPGINDAVTFNFNGRGNCTVDATVSVRTITVSFSYTGTITQGAHTISTSGTASFAGGTFAGGSGDITFGGNFTLSGATFTSTTGTLEFDGNTAFTLGTFNHNNGSVQYVASGNTTISGVSPTFYNLEFVGEGFTYTVSSAGNVSVVNSLNFSGTLGYTLNTGTFDVSGNINVTNIAAGCKGSAMVNINGTGAQLFSGSTVAGAGALPQVTINKTSGTLSLANYPASSNNFTYTAGTINAGTSTWVYTDGSSNPYTIKGSVTLNNITFLAIANATFTIPATTTLTTNGDLTIAGTNAITMNTGNINVLGNLYLTNAATGGGGSALITIQGSGTQAIDGTAVSIGQDLLPLITINKSGGTLTLKGNISESQNWKYTAGTVDASSFSSTVAFGGHNLSVTSAGMSFYNVSVTGNTITLANSMTAKGNLTITAGALAPGANTIHLSGSWSDYGTAGFTESTSTVNLNGSTLQSITTPGGETFANLVVNNTGSGIKLFTNTTIGTSLNMTSGNIDLNGHTLTTGLSVANNGTLTRTAGTIINTGSVIRWFKAAAIAGTTGLFPVGTVTDYRPLIVSTSTAPTAGGTISVFYTDASTNSAVTIPDGASIIQIRKDLNWTVSEANGLTNGTYNVQVQGTGFGEIGAVSDLRISLANSVVGTAGANGGTTSNPQVNRTGLTRANLNNTFYVGSVNPVFTSLPLNLLYFNGFFDNGQVTLNWATPSDNDAVFFVIERSRDGAGWEDWQRQDANSSGATIHYYSIVDVTPYPGSSFYRLRQEDASGNVLYSPVVVISQNRTSGGVIVFPVPATDHFTVGFPHPGIYVVELLNGIGQRVRSSLSSTGSSLTVPISGLPAGAYFVRILHDGTMETRTILIK